MRYISRAIVMVIACLVLFSVPHSADAAGTTTSVILTCSSFTVAGTTDQSHLGLAITFEYPDIYGIYFSHFQGFATSGGVTTGTILFPHQADGTLIFVRVFGSPDQAGDWDGQPFYFAELRACRDNGSNSNNVTWFNPGDARITGQPGDRLVVYCNTIATPPNIDVWVIDASSIGHDLAKLPLSDLASIAEGKFSKNLGVSGVLFAGLDASGNGYAALQGGPYGGTATGDWLKTFSCKAP